MRVHLVDGTYELFRAHYGRQPDREDPQGRDVKATVGVVASLLRLLHDPEEAVTHVAVAFDNPIESFRNELFAGYKSSAGVEATLLAQFDLVEDAVRAIGVHVWSMAKFEADDALATAAVTLANDPDVEQVRILTPDKDLGQVVAGSRIVQVDSMRQREFDEEGVVERLGVPPSSVPDYLGLVGDTADGIPGLKGFGAKSTAMLLGAYGHIEAIPDRAADWTVRPRGADVLAATLAAERSDALRWRDLASLVLDVELDVALEQLRFDGVPRQAFAAWCTELGVTTLAERVTRWA